MSLVSLDHDGRACYFAMSTAIQCVFGGSEVFRNFPEDGIRERASGIEPLDFHGDGPGQQSAYCGNANSNRHDQCLIQGGFAASHVPLKHNTIFQFIWQRPCLLLCVDLPLPLTHVLSAELPHLIIPAIQATVDGTA